MLTTSFGAPALRPACSKTIFAHDVLDRGTIDSQAAHGCGSVHDLVNGCCVERSAITRFTPAAVDLLPPCKIDLVVDDQIVHLR